MFHQKFLQKQPQHQNPLPVDRSQAFLQMQRTDPFCEHGSKQLINGKAPQHETDTFTHVKGLLYNHVMDSGKQFLALIIPKSWKYTVLVEAHDKLGSSRKLTYLLFNKKTILLERNEYKTLGNTLQIVYFAN